MGFRGQHMAPQIRSWFIYFVKVNYDEAVACPAHTPHYTPSTHQYTIYTVPVTTPVRYYSVYIVYVRVYIKI